MPGLTGIARAFKAAKRSRGAADGLKSRELLRSTLLRPNIGEVSFKGRVLTEDIAQKVRDVLPDYLEARALPTGVPLRIPWLKKRAHVRDQEFWTDATAIMQRHVDDSFWGESSGLSAVDSLLSATADLGKNPDKFQNTAVIVRMTPDEYIDKAATGLLRAFSFRGRSADLPPITKELIINQRINDRIRNTELRRIFISDGNMDIPVLWERGARGAEEGQEGLHRALIAKDLGMDEIPVAIVRKIEISDGT